ncbi:receptor-type tyrosine-protein phosphatase epsilon-like [Watersipora subatra]|uniref:receptor-type tyrosine-protein phosphatase epsilon-like n=1 Tax=Watersipora subatra TaxID=2589382 RepID=UPI00355B556D
MTPENTTQKKTTPKSTSLSQTMPPSNNSIVVASVVPSLIVLVIAVLITGVVFYKHRTQPSTSSFEKSSAFACVAGPSTAECRPHSASIGNGDTSTNGYEGLQVSTMSQQMNGKAYQTVLLTDQSVETQFERLERAVAQIRFDYSTAELPLNVIKNRFADILPTAQHAVTVYGTDYINAVFVNSFLQENQFIATQLPLSQTTSNFWKMIHERKVNVVVQLLPQMLDYFPDADGDEFYLDWGEMQRDDSSENSLIQLVHLTVEDRSVSVVKVRNWSDNQQEGSEMPKISSLLYYFQVVDSYVNGGSICVTDITGSQQVGVFITGYNLVAAIKSQHQPNLYETVLEARQRRPQFVSDLKSYAYLDEVRRFEISPDSLTSQTTHTM